MCQYRVRLELARCRAFPEGSAERGYELILPLQSGGALDIPACDAAPLGCRVRRFWPGEPEETGHLVHRGDRNWAIRFDDAEDSVGVGAGGDIDKDEDDGDGDEEPIFRLDRHHIVPGQYLTIRERDAVERTCRVVSIR